MAGAKRPGAWPGLPPCLSYAALAGDVDELATDGLVGATGAGRDTLGVPEDLSDAARGSEELFGGREVEVLLIAAGQLIGVPDRGVQVGVLLQVLWAEVVVPE